MRREEKKLFQKSLSKIDFREYTKNTL